MRTTPKNKSHTIACNYFVMMNQKTVAFFWMLLLLLNWFLIWHSFQVELIRVLFILFGFVYLKLYKNRIFEMTRKQTRKEKINQPIQEC